MNSIPIDEAQVHAELDLIAGEASRSNGAALNGAGATLEAGSPTESPTAPAPPMDWTVPSTGLVLVLDKVVMPNWELESEEKDLLLEQFKLTLGVFFPTVNLDPRVTAILALGGTFAMIAGKRIDYSTRTIKPLRKKREPAPEATEDAAGEYRAAA